jgi:catechol 2,3-dioxygenase-like lactoylglutathione lyase family enzyme
MSRLHHLDLTVSDVAKALDFYDRVLARLGFTRYRPDDDRAPEWRSPSLSIALHAAKRNQGQHDRYTPGLHHLAFNAESRAEIDAFHEFLIANSVTILDPPAEYDYDPGYYAVFFADPDGMKLELVHTPTWKPK